jgi:predicted O-linked N-acetylglucosamine transferase (SPINDLY family)
MQLRKPYPAAALETLDRLLTFHPRSPRALNNRAMALHDLGRLDEAVDSLDRALALRPAYHEALTNRAGLLFARRRFGEAAEAYARQLVLAHDAKLLGGLLRARMSACDWTAFDTLSAEIVARVARGEPADEPMSFTWHSLSPSLQRRLAEDYAARRFSQRPLAAAPRVDRARIRLAYLSSDFRDHPMPYMYAHLFERHDRSRFEVIAISYGPDDKSAMRTRLEKAFDRFIDIRGLSDLEAAHLVRHLEVDILLDLTGYAAGNRAGILAHRPALLQVNLQGFGMGAAFMDSSCRMPGPRRTSCAR